MKEIYELPGLYTLILVIGLVSVMKCYEINKRLTKKDIGEYKILGNRRKERFKETAIDNIDQRLILWILGIIIISPRLIYIEKSLLLYSIISILQCIMLICFIINYWNKLLVPLGKRTHEYFTEGIPTTIYLSDLILIYVLPCILKDIQNLISRIRINEYQIEIGPMLLMWIHSMILLTRIKQNIGRYKYGKSKRNLLGLLKCTIDFFSLIGRHPMAPFNRIWLYILSTLLSIIWDLMTFYKNNSKLKLVGVILTYCYAQKLLSMRKNIVKTIYGSESLSHYDIIRTIVWFIGRIELMIVNQKKY